MQQVKALQDTWMDRYSAMDATIRNKFGNFKPYKVDSRLESDGK